MVSVNASPYLVPAVLSLILLAGCTGAGSKGASVSQAPLTAPDAEFDETTGAVSGFVLSSEFDPLVAADVGIPDLAVATKTATNGGFSFSRLAPGTYVVQATALGYVPGQTAVTIEAGQSTEGVEVRLEPIAVGRPRAHVEQFTGLITCSVGTVGVLSEECGAGVGTPVGRYGTNVRNKIDWKVDVASFDGLKEIYFELDWVPASAAASMLGFNVAHGFVCEPSCEAKKTFCDVSANYGPPVQDCHIVTEKITIADPAKDLPYDITARAWAAPTEATEQPTLVFEQPFTMYRTDFYDMAKPADYTAIAPA